MLEFMKMPHKGVLTSVKLHFKPYKLVIKNKNHCHNWNNDQCSMTSSRQVALYSRGLPCVM